MVRYKFLVILSFLYLTGEVRAQVKYDFPQFWKETGQFFTMPAKWDAMDWGTLVLLGSLTAVA
ncbi:MAG: hypothetical protein ACHQM6_05190, partial [Candidatus Kapaibacterium sp.]